MTIKFTGIKPPAPPVIKKAITPPKPPPPPPAKPVVTGGSAAPAIRQQPSVDVRAQTQGRQVVGQLGRLIEAPKAPVADVPRAKRIVGEANRILRDLGTPGIDTRRNERRIHDQVGGTLVSPETASELERKIARRIVRDASREPTEAELNVFVSRPESRGVRPSPDAPQAQEAFARFRAQQLVEGLEQEVGSDALDELDEALDRPRVGDAIDTLVARARLAGLGEGRVSEVLDQLQTRAKLEDALSEPSVRDALEQAAQRQRIEELIDQPAARELFERLRTGAKVEDLLRDPRAAEILDGLDRWPGLNDALDQPGVQGALDQLRLRHQLEEGLGSRSAKEVLGEVRAHATIEDALENPRARELIDGLGAKERLAEIFGREDAATAIEDFVREDKVRDVLDHPANAEVLQDLRLRAGLAEALNDPATAELLERLTTPGDDAVEQFGDRLEARRKIEDALGDPNIRAAVDAFRARRALDPNLGGGVDSAAEGLRVQAALDGASGKVRDGRTPSVAEGVSAAVETAADRLRVQAALDGAKGKVRDGRTPSVAEGVSARVETAADRLRVQAALDGANGKVRDGRTPSVAEGIGAAVDTAAERLRAQALLDSVDSAGVDPGARLRAQKALDGVGELSAADRLRAQTLLDGANGKVRDGRAPATAAERIRAQLKRDEVGGIVTPADRLRAQRAVEGLGSVTAADRLRAQGIADRAGSSDVLDRLREKRVLGDSLLPTGGLLGGKGLGKLGDARGEFHTFGPGDSPEAAQAQAAREAAVTEAQAADANVAALEQQAAQDPHYQAELEEAKAYQATAWRAAGEAAAQEAELYAQNASPDEAAAKRAELAALSGDPAFAAGFAEVERTAAVQAEAEEIAELAEENPQAAAERYAASAAAHADDPAYAQALTEALPQETYDAWATTLASEQGSDEAAALAIVNSLESVSQIGGPGVAATLGEGIVEGLGDRAISQTAAEVFAQSVGAGNGASFAIEVQAAAIRAENPATAENLEHAVTVGLQQVEANFDAKTAEVERLNQELAALQAQWQEVLTPDQLEDAVAAYKAEHQEAYDDAEEAAGQLGRTLEATARVLNDPEKYSTQGASSDLAVVSEKVVGHLDRLAVTDAGANLAADALEKEAAGFPTFLSELETLGTNLQDEGKLANSLTDLVFRATALRGAYYVSQGTPEALDKAAALFRGVRETVPSSVADSSKFNNLIAFLENPANRGLPAAEFNRQFSEQLGAVKGSAFGDANSPAARAFASLGVVLGAASIVGTLGDDQAAVDDQLRVLTDALGVSRDAATLIQRAGTGGLLSLLTGEGTGRFLAGAGAAFDIINGIEAIADGDPAKAGLSFAAAAGALVATFATGWVGVAGAIVSALASIGSAILDAFRDSDKRVESATEFLKAAGFDDDDAARLAELSTQEGVDVGEYFRVQAGRTGKSQQEILDELLALPADELDFFVDNYENIHALGVQPSDLSALLEDHPELRDQPDAFRILADAVVTAGVQGPSAVAFINELLGEVSLEQVTEALHEAERNYSPDGSADSEETEAQNRGEHLLRALFARYEEIYEAVRDRVVNDDVLLD